MSIPSPLLNEPLENFTLKDLLEIPDEALDHVMGAAYQLYQSGYYHHAATLCRGLIAADQSYWWSYSLYAAALRGLGQIHQAIEQIEHGLRFEPGQPKLLMMRSEMLAALGQGVSSHDRNPDHAAAPPLAAAVG